MIDYRIGDCRELLKEIPDESVRLTLHMQSLTYPPIFTYSYTFQPFS